MERRKGATTSGSVMVEARGEGLDAVHGPSRHAGAARVEAPVAQLSVREVGQVEEPMQPGDVVGGGRVEEPRR